MKKINETHKQSFMMNVGIILFSQIMVKLLGMIYRLVITNVGGFGDQGNGFYNAGFQVYTLLLAISSVGIPNAISKMVSERTAKGDYLGAHKIFKSAFVLFAGVGLLASGALFLSSTFIARYVIKMEGVQYTLMSLSPSIFFVCISSVIRGYFTGLQNMKATSNSQILEQFFKCTLTILIVVVLVGQPPEIMSAGANLATSIATVFSFLYLLTFYHKNKHGVWKKIQDSAVESEVKPLGKMMKSILMISIPISLGAIISAVNRIVDTATITRGIEAAFANGIPAHFGSKGFEGIPTAKMLATEAVRLSGILAKSDVLINMPLALNIAFSTVLVPSISGALAVGNKKEASNKIAYSLLISVLIVLPCAIGYISLAQPIYDLIYRNARMGADLLQLSAVALIFTALNQTISGSLQGMGKIYVPATGLFCGCIAKVVLNIILIRQPNINIYGAAISSIVCQLISFLICFTVLSKNITLKISFTKYILKPLIASVSMGVCAYFSYKLLMLLTHIGALSTMISIFIAMIVYLLLLLKLNILSKSEIEMLPSGKKIYNFLERVHIYK